jgi:hypothetical protein
VRETLAGKHLLSGDEPEDADSDASVNDSQMIEVDGHPTLTSEEPLAPPLAVPTTPGPVVEERVTCPECGTVATVALTRRESTDFCVQCDYPLFWTPSKVVLGGPDTSAESLRRLPGTSGRVTVASVPCPHCAEGNPITAERCLRCDGLMNPPPPVPDVFVPPPPPAPEPEPEPPGTPLWVWIVVGTTLGLLVALVVYAIVNR